MIKKALENKIKVRGYVSCVLGCPYEKDINPQAVLSVSKRLLEMGCYEISLGDTIGIGTPEKTQILIDHLKNHISIDKLAVHFHDTFGSAIPNILVALEVNFQ